MLNKYAFAAILVMGLTVLGVTCSGSRDIVRAEL